MEKKKKSRIKLMGNKKLIKGKTKNLGFFTNELKASNAYQKELNLINSYVQFTNRN